MSNVVPTATLDIHARQPVRMYVLQELINAADYADIEFIEG